MKKLFIRFDNWLKARDEEYSFQSAISFFRIVGTGFIMLGVINIVLALI